MNNTNNLHDALNQYCDSDYLAMHMPGHKRNLDLVDATFKNDITEIDGFDNLKNPEGLIKNIAQDAARLWSADSALISVNGSTGLLIATIMALSSLGKILIASNCHISVWHGIEMAGAEASIINPETGTYFAGRINPDILKARLDGDPSIKSVIITSPTYEGMVSDTATIYKITKERGVILAVDEAHGAHFGLNPYFPASAMADIVIKSIHKTLSAPTQTAVMLFYGNTAPIKLVTHYKNSIESSSPSYVLMSGIDKALTCATGDYMAKWANTVSVAREALQALRHMSLYGSDDPSKFVIISGGISGYDLADKLRHDYHIEVEASFPGYIIAMTGIGDTSESLTRFVSALLEIDASLTNADTTNIAGTAFVNEGKVINGKTITAALTANHDEVPLSDINNHIGRTSAEYLFAYPPGIPLLIPGDTITAEVAQNITSLLHNGLHLTNEPHGTGNELFLVDTNT